MPARCVCYTTDGGYLLPTLVSAIDARRHSSVHDVDVVVYAFDVDARMLDAFAPAFADEGIRLIPAGAASIDRAPAMLARLFLAELLPTEYETFLYLDGDTQVRGSLAPLFEAAIPPGGFLAVSDPMIFALPDRDRHGRGINDHFASLGFSRSEAERYFNTGVLLVDRRGWSRIGLEAWQMFARQPQPSRFPDQDVLNIAGRAAHERLSLAWNFPIFMMNARVASVIEPRVHHYMSNPKPWQGVFPPWDEAAARPYADVVRRHPRLAPFLSTMAPATRLRYQLQQRYKRTLEFFTWGLGAKRERILDYERQAAASPLRRGGPRPALDKAA